MHSDNWFAKFNTRHSFPLYDIYNNVCTLYSLHLSWPCMQWPANYKSVQSDEYFLHDITIIRDLTAILATWRHNTTPPIETDELVTTVTIELCPSSSTNNRDLLSIRIVELSIAIGYAATACHLVGFTEKGSISLANLKKACYTVVGECVAI